MWGDGVPGWRALSLTGRDAVHFVDPHPRVVIAKLRPGPDVRHQPSAVRIGFLANGHILPLALAFGFLTLSAGPLAAHDIYTHLKNSAGRSCCDGSDCRPVPYRQTSSGVQMLIEGVWVTIPDSQVEQRAIEGDTGETGGGHWCGRRLNGENRFMTYCAFVPPSATRIVPHGPVGGSSRLVQDRLGGSGAHAH